MPIDPKSQATLSKVERELVDEMGLDAVTAGSSSDGGLVVVAAHIIGLFGAMKQLSAPLEARVVAGLKYYISEYESRAAPSSAPSTKKKTTKKKKTREG